MIFNILEHISRILNLNAKSLLLMLDISSEFDNCVAKFDRNKFNFTILIVKIHFSG